MTTWTLVPAQRAAWATSLVDRNLLLETGDMLVTESSLNLICETQGNPSQVTWTPVSPAAGFP